MDTLRITVVWSDAFQHGQRYARHIVRTFERLGMERGRIQIGVPVRVRCLNMSDGLPRPIDFDLAETNLVIWLSERELIRDLDGRWRDFFSPIQRKILDPSSGVYSLVAAMTKSGVALPGLSELEAERVYDYRNNYDTDLQDGSPSEHVRRLLLALVNYAGSVLRESDAKRRKEQTPPPIKLFLSHRNDAAVRPNGARAAVELIEARVASVQGKRSGVAAFLDTEDLPIGQNFQSEFEKAIKDGVFIAVHTDDYASRRYCKWEMLCAKRYHRPIVVAHMLESGEGRSFPYSGNTPLTVIATPPALSGRPKQQNEEVPPKRWWSFGRSKIEQPASRQDDEAPTTSIAYNRVIDLLLLEIMGETLRFLIFNRDAERAVEEHGEEPAAILARPPELSDIAEVHREARNNPGFSGRFVVYPDPPLDDAEIDLLDQVSAPFEAMTLSQYRTRSEAVGLQTALREKPLREKMIGVAVANVADDELLALGYQKLADSTSVLWQALSEFATVSAQLGARLGYGGDLREGGITRRLFDELNNAYNVLEVREHDRFVNYLALSVWRGIKSGRFVLSPEQLFAHVQNINMMGSIQIFFPDGSSLNLTGDDKASINARALKAGQASEFAGGYESADALLNIYENTTFEVKAAPEALTIMRRSMAMQEDARLLVGGSLQGSGRCPGVLEEAYESVRAGKLTLPLAAYGGAAHDAAMALGLLPNGPLLTRTSSERGAGKPIHPGYDLVMEQLAGERQNYRDILNAHGVSFEDVLAFAATDSPPMIAELSRTILLRSFASR